MHGGKGYRQGACSKAGTDKTFKKIYEVILMKLNKKIQTNKIINFKEDKKMSNVLLNKEEKSKVDIQALPAKAQRLKGGAKLSDDYLNVMANYAFENAKSLNNPILDAVSLIFSKLDQKYKAKFLYKYSTLIDADITKEVNYVMEYIFYRIERNNDYFNEYCLSDYLEYQVEGGSESFNDFMAERLANEVITQIDYMLEDNNYYLGDPLTDEEIDHIAWIRLFLSYEYGKAYLSDYIKEVRIELEDDEITFEDFVKLAISYGKRELV